MVRKQRGVLAVGQERDFRERARHRGAHEHHERRLLHAEVPRGAIDLAQLCVHRLLEHRCKVARLVDLVVQGDGLDDIRQAAHGLRRTGVLARGDRLGFRIRREVEEIGFEPAGADAFALALAWIDRKRSAADRLAMAVRSSSDT